MFEVPIEADLSSAVVRWSPQVSGVVDAIRRELALGRIVAGQRLPSVPALMARFEVGERVIAHVIDDLERFGIVVRAADGAFVLQDPEPEQSLLRPDLRDDPAGAIRFTEYRAVVEAGAAGYAAIRRTDADLAAMADAQRRLAAADTNVASRNADTAFHVAVARASRNPLLVEAVEDARMEIIGAADLMRVPFVKDASFHGHEVIMRAIRAGTPVPAAEAMRLHIETTISVFKRMLAERGDRSLPAKATADA